jgi:hypothetical protein
LPGTKADLSRSKKKREDSDRAESDPAKAMREFLSLEQWLIRRIHDWITWRRVGIVGPGIYRFIGIEWLRILPGFIRI